MFKKTAEKVKENERTDMDELSSSITDSYYRRKNINPHFRLASWIRNRCLIYKAQLLLLIIFVLLQGFLGFANMYKYMYLILIKRTQRHQTKINIKNIIKNK